EETSVNTNTVVNMAKRIIFLPIFGDAPKNFIKSKTTLLQFFPSLIYYRGKPSSTTSVTVPFGSKITRNDPSPP
ncbi:hypothetical protein ACT453_41155, partial [Bacillus sp. D-CC]